MSATTYPASSAPRREIVPLRVLWFGIFGAPTAWALQTIIDYALVSHFCFPGHAPLRAPTFGALRLTSLVVSAVALVVAVLALTTSVRSWKSTRRGEDAERHGPPQVDEGRTRFMAFGGVLLSGVFLFAALMNALPLITNAMCME